MIKSENFDPDRAQRIEFYRRYACQSIVQAMGGPEACADLPVVELEQHPGIDNLNINTLLLHKHPVWSGIYDAQWGQRPFFIVQSTVPETGESGFSLLYDNTVIGVSNAWATRNLTLLGPKFPQKPTVSDVALTLSQLRDGGWNDGQDIWAITSSSGVKKKAQPQ